MRYKLILGIMMLACFAGCPDSKAGESERVIAILRELKLSQSNVPAEVWIAGNELTISAWMEASSDEVYRQKATEVAQALAKGSDRKYERVQIFFNDIDRRQQFKSVALNAAQLKEIADGAAATVRIAAGESASDVELTVKAVRPGSGSGVSESSGALPPAVAELASLAPAAPAAQSAPSTGAAGRNYSAPKTAPGANKSKSSAFLQTRQRLWLLIQDLQRKGVNTKLYTDELARIDRVYSTGNVDASLVSINRLGQTVDDYNRRLALSVRESAKTAEASSGPSVSAGDFKDASKDTYKNLILKLLQQELGPGLEIVDGPFRFERIRVAKKIREMEQSGQNVKGYQNQYNRMNDLVRDPRRVTELRDQIRYMEMQLNLPPLK